MVVTTEARANPFRVGGVFMVTIFLLITYSRAFEVVLDNSYHLPLITGAVAVFLAIFAGQLRDTLTHPLTQLFGVFTLWFIACIPFAYWRRGSIAVFTERWAKSLMVFFAIAALVVSMRQLRKLYLYLMVAVTLAAMLTIRYGVVLEGRLAMVRGELANSNQLAMVALMGMPLALVLVMDRTWNKLIRLAAAGSLVLLASTILRTGSRTGFLSLIVLATVLFLTLPPIGKFVAGTATVVVLGGITLALPSQVTARLASVFSDEPQAETVEDLKSRNSSRESAETRMQVLKEGVTYTLEHPIFGLGPGNFVERRNDDYHKRYGHQGYLASHNSYVQVSSEMGIPGLVLFLAILGVMYRVSARIRKKFKTAKSGADLQLKHLAFGMGLMILMLAVFCFFNHIAYDLYIPTMAGLLVAMDRVSRNHEQATQRAQAAPASLPVPVAGPQIPWRTPQPTVQSYTPGISPLAFTPSVASKGPRAPHPRLRG